MSDEQGWNGPRRHDEAGLGRLLNRIKQLEQQVADLQRGAPLRSAGIRMSPDGLTVHSSLDVEGSLAATGDTQIGGTLDVTGQADFSGDTTIGGNLDVIGSATVTSTIRGLHANGTDGVLFGRLIHESDGSPAGVGLLVEKDDREDILVAKTDETGSSQIRAHADEFILITADSGFGLRVPKPVGDGWNVDLYGIDETLVATAQGSVFVTAETGSVAITAENGGAYVTGSPVGFRSPNGSGGWAVDVHSGTSRFNAVADNGFILRTPNNSHRIQVTGNDIGVDAPNRFYVAANVHATGDLSCGGTKPFIIDHPIKGDKSLVHVATESDKAVIEYHYRVTIGDDGSTTINLPDYFEALTAPDSRGVQVTPVGRPFMVGAEEPADGQVVVYGDPGREVFVRVNARRGDDAGQFEVEIPRIQPPDYTEEGQP